MATQITIEPETLLNQAEAQNESPPNYYQSERPPLLQFKSIEVLPEYQHDSELGGSFMNQNGETDANLGKKYSQSILDLGNLEKELNVSRPPVEAESSVKHRRLVKISQPVSPIHENWEDKVTFSDLVSPPSSATRRQKNWIMNPNSSLSLKIQAPLEMGVIKEEEFAEGDGENSPKLKATRSKNSVNSVNQGQLRSSAVHEDIPAESTTRQRFDHKPPLSQPMGNNNEYADDTTYTRKNTESFSLQDRYYMEFESAYSFRSYAVFYLLHMVYYNLLGNFFEWVVWPIRSLRIAAKNMLFGFRLNIPSWINVVWFGISLLTKVGYFWGGFVVTNHVSVFLDILSLSGVSSLIAAKYATFPSKMIQRVFSEVIPADERRREEQFGEWQHQTNEIINSEYRVAMARNKFDTGVFWLQFLFDLSPRIKKELEDFKKSGFLNFDPVKRIKTKGGKERVYYSGKALFFALVRIHHADKETSGVYWRVIICGMFWGFSPIFSRLMCGLPIINPNNKLDTATLFMHSVSLWALFYYQNSFYIRAMIDVGRVKFMMEELRHMISKNTGMGETKRVFPTINFMDEISINSWRIMRRVAIDYGKKFYYRHEIFLPYIFIVGTACLIGITILEVISSKSPDYFLKNNMNKAEIQLCLLEISMLSFYFTYHLLVEFAGINEYFDMHTLKIASLHSAFSDLLSFKSHYFDIEDKDAISNSVDVRQLFELQSTSSVHQKIISESRLALGDQLATTVGQHLQQNISSLESITEYIQIEQEHQSVKILGYTVTRSFTNNLFFFIFSVAFSIYQLATSSS